MENMKEQRRKVIYDKIYLLGDWRTLESRKLEEFQLRR